MRGWPVTLTEPHLLTEPVELRPVRVGDARMWREIRVRNAQWLRPWEPTNPETPLYRSSLGPYIAMVRAMRREAKEGQAIPWVMSYGGVFAGQLTVGSITWGSARSGQVGYWVDEAYAGRGITPTTLAMAVDHCFSVVGLHRLEASIRPENHASRRVVEKLGFREEGIRVRQLHINGAWRDHVCYALTAEEVPQGLMPRWRSILLASRSNAGLFVLLLSLFCLSSVLLLSGFCWVSRGWREECCDTPGRVLVYGRFSYYFASREHAQGEQHAHSRGPGHPPSGRPGRPPLATPRGGSLSSAILYVAIVAIWACVLIPRWLRRDSSARVSDETATVEETPEADERLVPEPRRRPRSRPREAEAPRAPQTAQTPRIPQAREGGGDIRRDREHARVLSSRRRLLGLLVLLAIGSAALAVTRLAAWWVLGPPSVMLLGYLALLREASKADAERRELIRARTARVGGVDKAVPAAPAAPAARPVRVPDAEIIDISASRGPANGELYDQYADAKLRAVGD